MTLEAVKDEPKPTVIKVDTMGKVPPCGITTVGEREVFLVGGLTVVCRDVVVQTRIAELDTLKKMKSEIEADRAKIDAADAQADEFLAIIRTPCGK
jgi:hypothetical protein